MEDEAGVVARANSLWALLDFEKRSLLRADALGSDLPYFPDLSGGLLCQRLFCPREATPLAVDTRKIYASMLDRNNHLNNCNYADLATDLLPEEHPEVREMHITFQKEARLGEVLSLEAFPEEKGALVSGFFRDRGEPCFLCKINLF